jgi:hypothetical protein
MTAAWKKLLTSTAVLLFVAVPCRAQVPVYLPQPSAAAAPTGAANYADPAPIYQTPVYQPPVYQAPTYQPPAYQPPAYPPQVAMQVAAVPTPTPVAPWPAAHNHMNPMPTPVPGMQPAAAAPWTASRTPPTPVNGATSFPAVSLPGYSSGPSGGPAYAQQGPSSYHHSPTAYGPQSSCAPQFYPPGSNDSGYDHGCCGTYDKWCDNFAVISELSAFKGPLDLDGLNGNFGARAGVYGGIPIVKSWGLGAQLGSTAGWYDWKGSLYTGEDDRFQHFITGGVFQRFESTGISVGAVYDWLYDDYYADMYFGQWRAAAGWQFNECNEVGVWAALPDRHDETFVGTPAVLNRFSPVLQGSVYWRHVWNCTASTTIFAGLAETPCDVPVGARAQVPLNNYIALTGGVEYILPGSGGDEGRQEELWNLSIGLTIYPGSAMRVAHSQFRPVLPMADNANFGIYRE